MTLPARRKMSPADPRCPTCGGVGFTLKADDGAGTARFCSCRFRVVEEQTEEPAPQALLDLETTAARLEESDGS